MKKRLLFLINCLMKNFNVQVVRYNQNESKAYFSMSALLDRLSHRDVPFRTIIDIGASDGKWSIKAMEHFPKSEFLAIEPLEQRRNSLEVAKCKFRNFDYALCVAGASDGEEVTLNVTPDLDGSTVNGKNPGYAVKYHVRTIDSLLAEKRFPGPYLLKFDTHGYEMQILKGCGHTLKDTNAILMETYNFQLTDSSLNFHEMCSNLGTFGFRPVDIADPLLREYDQSFWQVDILFLKSNYKGFNYPHFK